MKKKLATDALIPYRDHYYTGTDIAAMREWIADCMWVDANDDYITALTPAQVLNGIERHVDGGLIEFINNML